MTDKETMNKRLLETITAGGMKTDRGFVYPVPPKGKQIITLVISFFAAILLGFIISSIP